jgi:hypothetical protein
MREHLTETQLDRELRAFLDWQAEDVAGAPLASEVAARVRQQRRPAALSRDLAPLALALLLVALLALAFGAAVFVGSRGPQPRTMVQNGWIAYSTQPGFVQTSETDWAEGGDIYLVREGVDPRLIVERGAALKRNVCPQFSPDGSKLAYGELAGKAGSIVVLSVSRDGTVEEWRRLAIPGASSDAPCPRWSSTGTRIAYLENSNSNVKVLDLDGRRVAPTEVDPTLPDFNPRDPKMADRNALLAPDGTLRAVCVEDVGVVVGPPDGSADREVSRSCGYSIAAWSPDGSKLLVLSDGGRNASMAVVSVTEPRPLQHEYMAPFIPVNGARSFPGQGDISWQPTGP